MIRRSLYKGGDIGVRNRDANARNILRIFAKSDFMHDFGENVETRDKYTAADVERFLEIAQRYGISKVKALVGGFNSVINQNPYFILKPDIHTQIYPDAGEEGEYIDEVSVMNRIGLDYNALKDSIRAAKGTRTEQDLLQNPLRIEDATYSFAGETRTYDVTAVPMKIDGVTANIATVFHKVTGGQKKFAVVIDAAGGLSMTSVRNADLEPYTETGAEKFEFYIIENIENASDSATKLKNIDKPKARDNVNLFFLKDVPKTAIYYPFGETFTSQGENLYGNARLVLSRTEEDTEADFFYTAEESYHIENVSQNANVKNASLNLLAAKLANRGREAYMYPYLKRVGDWCQALSLLDTTREYIVLDSDHNPVPTPSRSLKEIAEDGELAIVTLDRILLAYALGLGINVFFTTGSNLSMLLYFKNKETRLTPEQVAAKIAPLAAERAELLKETYEDTTLPFLSQVAAFVKDDTISDLVYLQRLRSALSNISAMRFAFKTLEADIVAAEAKIAAGEANIEGPDPMVVYSAYYDANALRKRYLADKAHNAALSSSIERALYPDLVLEKGYFETLAGARPSRNAIFKTKEVISKKMYDDVLQAKRVFADYGVADEFSSLFRPAKSPELSDVFEAFRPIWLLVNAPMVGGGLAEDVLALKQFVVKPVSSSVYKELSEREDVENVEYENTLILVEGSYYRDEKSNTYTVLDEYLITEEDLTTFHSIHSQLVPDSPNLPFIALRYILLYSDLLNARYEQLSSNEEIQAVREDDESDVDFSEHEQRYVESDVNFSEHKRLHVEATQLLDIANALYGTKDYLGAFKAAVQLKTNAQKWDTSTIQVYTGEGGRGYYIRNNDYTRIIANIRSINGLIKEMANPRAKKAPSKNRTPPKSVKSQALNATSSPGRQIYGGGLEERRPLYSNDQQRSSPPTESERDEGLRKRRGTRRTSRVRQHTGKPRTRRQRKHVDRV